MKYKLLDGEIHTQETEGGAWWPISLAETERLLARLNALVPAEVHERPPTAGRSWAQLLRRHETHLTKIGWKQ